MHPGQRRIESTIEKRKLYYSMFYCFIRDLLSVYFIENRELGEVKGHSMPVIRNCQIGSVWTLSIVFPLFSES